eukprot:1770386-Lingulodinium_polyedra.AAC.2
MAGCDSTVHWCSRHYNGASTWPQLSLQASAVCSSHCQVFKPVLRAEASVECSKQCQVFKPVPSLQATA